MRLHALVVTHDRLAKLRETVSRLLSDPALTGLLVLDNASTDGTADWLATLADPRVSVLRLAENLGGAGGFETGLRHLIAGTDADWIVLMDDDARPEPGALARFAANARDSHAAWLAAVRYPSGSICEMNRPWRNPFGPLSSVLALRRGRAGFHLPDAAYDGPVTEIDGGSFVGFFVSRTAIRATGYPDGGLFLYGDDVMWSLDLRDAGGRIAFDPALRFEHDCMTIGTVDPRVRPLWKVYYLCRNRLLMYRRAAGPILFWPIAALVAVRWALQARHYGPDRRAYLRLLRAAVADGLRNRRGRLSG